MTPKPCMKIKSRDKQKVWILFVSAPIVGAGSRRGRLGCEERLNNGVWLRKENDVKGETTTLEACYRRRSNNSLLFWCRRTFGYSYLVFWPCWSFVHLLVILLLHIFHFWYFYSQLPQHSTFNLSFFNNVIVIYMHRLCRIRHRHYCVTHCLKHNKPSTNTT